MLWFFVLTSVYFPIKYYSGGGKQTDDSRTQGYIYAGIYILLLIVGEYFINLGLTESLCGTNQWDTALFVTLIPWVVIFGILNLMLLVFPGWLSPFSNTFGYAVARLSGISSLMDEILLPKIDGDGGKKEDKEAAQALARIYTDQSLLLNEITQANFSEFWDKTSVLFKPNVKNNQSLKDQLFDFIRMKDIVAEYIWYMLVGFLVTSVSYNYVVNTGCSQSAAEMEQRHKDYQAKEGEIQDDKAQGIQPRVYSSDE
jgi:type VI protein secretion system component Hcp